MTEKKVFDQTFSIKSLEAAERAMMKLKTTDMMRYELVDKKYHYFVALDDALEILQRLKANLFSQKALPKTTGKRIDSVAELRKTIEHCFRTSDGINEPLRDTDEIEHEVYQTIDSFEAGLRERIELFSKEKTSENAVEHIKAIICPALCDGYDKCKVCRFDRELTVFGQAFSQKRLLEELRRVLGKDGEEK